MILKNKEQQESLTKNISILSTLVRKLYLYCNFLSKSKQLEHNYIKNQISSIKKYIENIENNL